MIIVIPLGGIGQRFKDLGYTKPKPLITVMGKPILFWLLDNLYLESHPDTKIIIPYNSELSRYNFEDLLRHHYDFRFKFVNIDKKTTGAVETILIGLQDEDTNDAMICLDGDNFYFEPILDIWNKDNQIFCFDDHSQDAIYSYLELDPDNQFVSRIKEKEKISSLASSGAYGFKSIKEFKKYAVECLEQPTAEHYTSHLIQLMIQNGHKFQHAKVNIDKYICLGTPLHLRLFCNNLPRINALNHQQTLKPKRYCFDLDNTLVTYPQIKGDYTTVEPIKHNITFLKYLKKLGNTIIIYTARRMKTHSGNQGKLLADIGKITFDTLDKFEIPYDEIYFGKPYADYYIDDLAISPFSDLEKELGFYQSRINPRDFNVTESKSIQIYVKSNSNRKKSLKGEIYYYQHIPDTVKDIFPIFLTYDLEGQWYKMEEVNGIPISRLFVQGDLTTEHLKHIIGTLKRIHNSQTSNLESDSYLDQEKIYNLYLPKLKTRYQQYDYSRFPDAESRMEEFNTFFKKYQEEHRGKISVIHGDPVLTNILINNFGKIKMIDMRGCLPNISDLEETEIYTIYGDQMYDWGKLYQSLIGYDYILEEKSINLEYQNKLITYFKSEMVSLYGPDIMEDIKMITKSLIFSMLPLHSQFQDRFYKLLKINC